MARIVVAAGYASVRAGLSALLEEAAAGDVVGSAAGAWALEVEWSRTRPDIVVAEEDGSGTEDLAGMLSGRGTPLVLLSDDSDASVRLAGAGLPGWAVLRRDADRDALAAAVRAALAGLIVLDVGQSERLAAPPAPARRYTEADLLPGESLTAREREVIQRMADGLPNKQIAGQLGISLSTVKFHVASILTKLGASSRTEAVTIGARRGDVVL